MHSHKGNRAGILNYAVQEGTEVLLESKAVLTGKGMASELVLQSAGTCSMGQFVSVLSHL